MFKQVLNHRGSFLNKNHHHGSMGLFFNEAGLIRRHLAASPPSSSDKKTTPVFPPYKVEHLHDTNYYNIPALPLPPLKKTFARYLESIEPLCTKEELAQTRKYVDEFLRSDIAKSLQAQLEKVAAHPETYPHSYIEKYWDEMYYGGRWPLMIHVNPFFLFLDDANEMKNPLLRAAKFSTSLVRWWRKVVEGRLEPDMENGKPLCSYQFGQVFGVERVPSETRDGLVRHPHSKHIVVIHKREFFRVDLVTDDGKVLSPELVEAQFKAIVAKMKQESNPSLAKDVGVITSGGRIEYAKTRAQLEKRAGNTASFKDIDECLFICVLDHEAWGEDRKIRSQAMLHGKDGGNRWWDKHQVVISADGVLGMSFEHGCNDGMTWSRMCHEAYHDMRGEKSMFSPLNISVATKEISKPKHLKFQVTAEDEKNIQECIKFARGQIDDVDTHVANFTEFGRNTIKNWKISPDAVAQMSFQLAYRRLHGKNAATYEACAMKNWYHGRTETIRSCTKQSSLMCDAFMNPKATDDEKRNLLREACKRHVELAIGARNAGADDNLGCDRHMRALKCLAEERAFPVPGVFSDPVYGRSTNWIISTSNVTTPIYEIFGFGAVAGEGYGLGYMTAPNHIPLNVTSFKSGQKPETSSAHMANEIIKALQDFKKLFP